MGRSYLLWIVMSFACYRGASFGDVPTIEWERTFGGAGDEEAFSVEQTDDGGYILGGYTDPFGADSGDVYLIKTAADGTEEWSRTFGGAGLDTGSSAKQASDGGYIIAGWSDSFGAGDNNFYLIKTDCEGQEEWSRTYGNDGHDMAWSVIETSDGAYVVAGHTWPFLSDQCDVLVIRTDSEGLPEWSRVHGDSREDWALSIQETAEGGYIVGGHSWSYGAGRNDAYLLKLDALGEAEWWRTFGGTGNDFAWMAQETQDSGFILAGGTASFGEGWSSVYLIKTDAAGREAWWRTYGGTEEDLAFAVQQTHDGGYVLSGMTRSRGDVNGDVYLIKTDGSGTEEWATTLGGEEDELGYSVQETRDGGYVIAGSTKSHGAGGRDVHLAKLGLQPTPFKRGDSNADGVVDLSDAVTTLGWLFLGGEDPRCFDAADSDDSGELLITDPIFQLGVLFLGSGGFPPPFPGCGLDPTEDLLSCRNGCE